jgi:acetyl esterase/lipase
MQHPSDLAAVIVSDHRLVELLFDRLERNEGDRGRLVHQLIFNLSIHAGAEEQLVYPAMREAFGDEPVDEARDDHQAMKDALVILDRGEPGEPEFEEALGRLIAEVRHHAPEEERDLLPRLRQAVGDARMVELGKEFLTKEKSAPTRPHPHSPSSPIVAAPAALVDQMRDKIGDRDAAATDASGMLDADAQAVVDQLAALGIKPLHLLQPEQARRQPTPGDAVEALLTKRGEQPTPPPVGDVQELRLPGPVGDIDIAVYRPTDWHPDARAGGELLPVLIYIHGGGWVIGDLAAYEATPRGLVNRTGCMAVSVEYRHAPEHPFPAAHDDVLAATRWIMANAASLGGDPSRIAIAGESAGANMVAATCLTLKQAGEPLPLLQALIYPVASAAMDTASYDEARDAKPLYSGLMPWYFSHLVTDPADLRDPRICLVDVPIEQLAGLPPTVVITAERDPLRDEGELLASRMRQAGVAVTATRYTGVMHEFFGMAPVIKKAAEAQDEVARALMTAFGAVQASERR